MILQADQAEDWVIATGQTTTVRDFVKLAFNYAGIGLRFEGKGVDELGIVDSIDHARAKELGLDLSHLSEGQVIVSVDPRYFRPTEVDLLIGDPTKAETKLGWSREYDLKDLVNDMMQSDLKMVTKDVYLQQGGYKTMSYFE